MKKFHNSIDSRPKVRYSVSAFRGSEKREAKLKIMQDILIDERHTFQGAASRSLGTTVPPLPQFLFPRLAGQPARVLEFDSSTLGSATCLHRDQTFAYDAAGRTISEVGGSGSWFSGLTISSHYDPTLGRDSLTVSQGGSNVLAVSYGYDGYGRMNAVTSGPDTAEYTYKPNSDLIAATTFQHNGTTNLTTTKTWDIGQRLQSIANVANNKPVTSHAYAYDALHRRTRALLEDGSSWRYGYNGRDELIGGKRYWSDSQPVAGQQFEYAYDNIGNRTTSKSGGDASGANLRTASYSADAANQYTTVATPGYQNIIGVALNDNSVTVNGGQADRRQEYFHREISVANGSGPIWQSNNIAVAIGGSGSSTNGGCVWPAASQSLAYDASGNLTNDGVWSYRWDSENRLLEMTMAANISNLPGTQRKKLEFAYDFQGRRIRKIVSNWVSGNWSQVADYLFVYDGWNLSATLSSSRAPLTIFLWGLDLSGSEQGAGGVAGLLIERQFAGPQLANPQYPCYDGNGNVMALVASDGSLAARYDYSPFGDTIRATGPLAEANPFRWSTRYADAESSLIFYGHRYYQPVLGRWTSRDRSQENGGLNLLVYVANSPVGSIDSLGDVRIEFDSKMLHVHDTEEGVTYGIRSAADGMPELYNLGGKQHGAEFDLEKARRSFQNIVADPAEFAKLRKINAGHWDVYQGARDIIRGTGRALKAVGKAAGAVAGLMAIATAVSASSEAAETAQSYARNLQQGETAYADLDAISIAIDIQDATGNYFITHEVLGILLK